LSHSQIVGSILELIDKERQGEVVNSSAIASCVRCLLALGIEANHRYGPLHVYKEDFEKPFLEVSSTACLSSVSFVQTAKLFYEVESNDFLHSNSVAEYIRKVLELILLVAIFILAGTCTYGGGEVAR
jgi:hypothetical protein